MTEARAVWFTAPGRAELRAARVLDPDEGEVTVEARASAISHGTELLVYRGQVPPDLALDLPTLEGGFGFPIKYGYASAGRIVATGKGVQSPRVGDAVFVHHPHQTRYTVPAGSAIPLPHGVPPEHGAFLANLETAVNVVLDAHPRLGDRVAVFGQGVVGLLVTLLLRRAGVDLIVTIDGHERRRRLSREMGADLALEPGPGAEAQLWSRSGGGGMDLAIEASGSVGALDTAIHCLGFQGTLVVGSWYGTKRAALSLGGAFHRRRLRIIGSQVSSIDPALAPRWDRERRLDLARRLMTELPLDRLVTHRVPFDRAAEAYRLISEHPEETVQVLLTY